MTSSMLRRQLKNLVQNYSEAEVKVREATSNDPWGPSSSQMADLSDLTYNVVACNEIMTMLWKRLKDDKNWRHIHKSLTLLEYLLKTGDDRVLLQMKDNIYIVKALTEYRFVEKDGKDQGGNVREKAKVVLVLMEDDDKLKEERDFAVKTREKTSKNAAASSTDAIKDPNYKPCYVVGAPGLPSLDNIPSVADLTASFAARKEERLKQEAEKRDKERRAKMSEEELKWEDAGKGNDEKGAWGGAKAEEQEQEEEVKVKPDAWGAPTEPKEAADPWGTTTKPDATDTAAIGDPWGAPTKTDEDAFAAPKKGGDPFATPNDQPFNSPKDKDDPFTAAKDDPFTAPASTPPKDDTFAAPTPPKEDPFSASSNPTKEDSFVAPSTLSKEDPFKGPYSPPKGDVSDPFNAPLLSSPQDSADAWGAPASSPPIDGSHTWGVPSAQKETKGEDPWGDGTSTFSPVDNSDAFEDASKLDNDPWGAPAAAPVSTDDAWGSPAPPLASSPSSDPFGDGGSKTGDPWGAPSNAPSNGAGELKARGMTYGPVAAAGFSLHETSTPPRGPFGSTLAPCFGAPSAHFGAANPFSETPLVQLPSHTTGVSHSVFNTPPRSVTGVVQSVSMGRKPVSPSFGGRGMVQSGSPVGNPFKDPLSMGPGMDPSRFFGGNCQAGVADWGESTQRAGGGVPLDGSADPVKRTNNPFLF